MEFTAQVQELLKKDASLTPAQVCEKLQLPNTDKIPNRISQIKLQLKRKGEIKYQSRIPAKSKRRKRHVSKAPRKGSGFSIEQLSKLARLAEDMNGFDNLREAVKFVESIQTPGKFDGRA